jgi:hypothetical protein
VYLAPETVGGMASEAQILAHCDQDAQAGMIDERAHSSWLVVKVTAVASCRLDSLSLETSISNDKDAHLAEANMPVVQVISDDRTSPESDHDAVTVVDCSL